MNSQTQQFSVKDRLFGLDLLRAIAVVCVLIAHTAKIWGHTYFTHHASIYGAVWGVEIFFVLSGFLIGTILIKVHNQDTFTSFDSVKVFWIRRWFRTLPNYYLMLGVYILLFYLLAEDYTFFTIKQLSYLVFLQNLTPQFPHLYFFGVSWSLSIEEWFYLLFPLLLFLTQYISPTKFSSLSIALATFIITPLLLRVYISGHVNWPWDEGFRKVIPLRLDSIAIGVFVAFFKYYFPSIWERQKNNLATVGVLLLALLAIELKFDFINHYDARLDTPTGPVSTFLKTLFFTLNSVGIGLCLPFFYYLKQKDGFYKWSITTISLISYSLYLLHPVVIIVVGLLVGEYPAVNFVLIWVVSLVGAYWQYHLFEKRFTAIRDNFGKKKDAISIV